MTIRAWRITKARLVDSAFTGDGAKAYGGRWNSVGHAVVYTAGSESLAILENIKLSELPSSWRDSPSSVAVQQVGDDWIARGSSAVLQLPSAIVPAEWNFLLNPMHRNFSRITIGHFREVQLDPRLVKTNTP
jgi:RES domain-containing protein